MEEEVTKPLWMPRGSVRAMLALTAMGGSVYAVLQGMALPGWMIAVVGTVVAFYFSARK